MCSPRLNYGPDKKLNLGLIYNIFCKVVLLYYIPYKGFVLNLTIVRVSIDSLLVLMILVRFPSRRERKKCGNYLISAQKTDSFQFSCVPFRNQSDVDSIVRVLMLTTFRTEPPIKLNLYIPKFY